MGSINFAAPFQLLRPSGAARTQSPQPYGLLGALAQMQPLASAPQLVADPNYIWVRRKSVQRTVCVYFDSPRGKFGHVTAGRSLFEAAANVLDWFSDPHWHGPRPSPSTVLEITLVGDERRWLVAARRVMEWRAQETLVPKCSANA
jgi:hypothetical protein